MRIQEFMQRTGLSYKTAVWYHKQKYKKETKKHRYFSEEDVNYILQRKLENFKGVIKNIDGYSNYYITDTGKVYTNSRGFLEQIKGYICNNYNYVHIYKEGKRQNIKVSRLVAMTYIPKLDLTFNIVNHIDGNKLNDNVSNLEWTTISGNTKHAYSTGLAKNAKGIEDSQSMPVYLVNLNGDKIHFYGSISEAAKDMNKSKSTIARAAKKNTERFLRGEKLLSHTQFTYIFAYAFEIK